MAWNLPRKIISANLSGFCGISVPCALSRDGLPIGVQILGPALGESAVLRAAYLYEQVSPVAGAVPQAAL